MTFSPGKQLGSYEVLGPLGAGGMGEVYRAHDTKLGREVAIKVLPEAFAKDPERLARFEREARLLASLNHPNIAAIYGLEESGGTHYLVMEMVPGETLAECLTAGPLAIEEALGICTQIAEALEHAHEKGVIHRDLKPANVKVTPDDKVKVLDFGLAKAFAEPSASDVVDSQSPTLMTASPTMPGVILGTAAYMSPEQARGKTVDKRTDIWAFGCVLYELLTGRQAFQSRDREGADTVQDIIARILQGEPDWAALPDNTQPGIRALLRRCLKKEARHRLRDAGDLRIQIEDSLNAPTAPIPARTGWRQAIPLVLGSLVLGAIIASLAAWILWPPPPPMARFTVALPPGERLGGLAQRPLAVSPDGTMLVYVAERGGVVQLFLRALDSEEAKPIPGAEGAESPFFSPDGQWVGFFAEGDLRKISISGGAPSVLAPAPGGRGGSWGRDDSIIFAAGSTSGLSRVSASGGTPESLTTVDREKGEGAHRFPHYLPDGRAILFTVGTGGSWDEARIEALRLDTGERKVLIEGGSDAHYVPTGHLIYHRAGSLMAVPFDLDRLEVTSPPVAVVEGVMQSIYFTGSAQAAFSNQGWLVYVPGSGPAAERTIVWVDRNGAEQTLDVPPRPYGFAKISPNGQRLAVGIDQGNRYDLWTHDITRGTLTRLTFEGDSWYPLWASDGERIAFGSNKTGAYNLFWKPADGSGVEERLTTNEYSQFPTSWSPDGQLLAYTESHPDTGLDIWVLPLEGERKPRPFLATPFNEGGAMFSPDGRWLAYVSDESGRDEVYMQPFPGPGGKRLISTEGGREPLWARNGRELFYRQGDELMAVEIKLEPFTAGKPTMLFEGRYMPMQRPSPNYDVTPDGQRFVFIKSSAEELAVTQLNVVLNWFEELKRRVPSGQ